MLHTTTANLVEKAENIARKVPKRTISHAQQEISDTVGWATHIVGDLIIYGLSIGLTALALIMVRFLQRFGPRCHISHRTECLRSRDARPDKENEIQRGIEGRNDNASEPGS